ncbi:RNA polymerase sigma factor [Chitinophaga tropicalis]|nr:sigma-70 family RNA polymerase sigma factor [Chitinophaga tropicalis]
MTQHKENNKEDQSLVYKVLHGNMEAFETIIKNTERLVTQIVFKMVQHADDRKDLMQDIYLNVFQKLSSFRFQARLSTWIAQIAYNACLNYATKKKLVLLNTWHTENDNEDETLNKALDKFNLFYGETEKLLFQKELAKILEDEINNLAPIHKTLIILYHYEEISYEEISQITALPIGTVKSYLFRARKTLRDNLLLRYKKDSL